MAHNHEQLERAHSICSASHQRIIAAIESPLAAHELLFSPHIFVWGKKEELKCLNEQITKQDDMVDHKPKSNMNNYVCAIGLSVLGLAIGGYLLYSKFKKQKQNLIDVPPPPVPKTSTEPKRDIFEML